MIKAIVAIDNKRGMATDDGIPWKLPSDIKYYRKLTSSGAILMGYGTYVEFERPFHGRVNYVANDKKISLRLGFKLVLDARQFLSQFKGDIWNIGGPGLLKHTLDLIDELYITQIDGDFNCTKFFPEFKHDFKLVSQSDPIIENGITFYFQLWKRN